MISKLPREFTLGLDFHELDFKLDKFCCDTISSYTWHFDTKPEDSKTKIQAVRNYLKFQEMSAQTPITRLMKRLSSSRRRQTHTLVRVSPYSDRSIWHIKDPSKQAQKGDLVCKEIGCTGRAKVIDGLARVTAPHNCTLWVPYAQTIMSSLQGRENLPRYLAEMAPMDSNLQIILAKAFYVSFSPSCQSTKLSFEFRPTTVNTMQSLSSQRIISFLVEASSISNGTAQRHSQ